MDNKHSDAYYDILKSQSREDLTLAELAEIWHYRSSGNIPDRNTDEWKKCMLNG
jgi:hypothetical protein